MILTRSRNGKMPKVTPRAICEVVGDWYETAVLDEAKLIFGIGRASQELQGILLAGLHPAVVVRDQGQAVAGVRRRGLRRQGRAHHRHLRRAR